MMRIEAPKQDRLQHTEHPRRQVGAPHAARAVIVLAPHDWVVYRSTVFWTPSDLKLSCSRQGTLLLVSHLGGCFVSMPPNQPGLIVLTLKLVQRQAEFFHRIKGLEP
jgi:hypothetical protein